LEYLKKLPPAGCYISNLIFNKKFWDSVPNKNKYIGTAYVHFYVFIYLLNKNYKIKFISSKLIYLKIVPILLTPSLIFRIIGYIYIKLGFKYYGG